jgi:hypothetical protein
MRVATSMVTAVLAAFVAFPAAAATKQSNPVQASAGKSSNPTWEQCHIAAMRHGLAHGQDGNTGFMKQCMNGKVRP